MADELLNCGADAEVRKIDWNNVVGNKSLIDGGYYGDLLEIARAHIEDSKNNGELTEAEAGNVYATAIIESMKSAIAFELGESKTDLELCFLRAQIDKLNAETDKTLEEVDLVKAQTAEVYAATEREDCKAESQCALTDQQKEKLIIDGVNDTNLTDSKISLNAAQENKLACDCCNQAKISSAQARLYERQIEGFNDNANQKLYDSQMQAWSMVFADTDIDAITPSIVDKQICDTYTNLKARLNGTWDEDGNFTPGAVPACESGI